MAFYYFKKLKYPTIIFIELSVSGKTELKWMLKDSLQLDNKLGGKLGIAEEKKTSEI